MQWDRRINLKFTVVILASTPALAEPVTAPSVARAEAEATVSSVIAGTVKELPFDEGDEFREGDVLARLDCSLHEAEAESLRAEHEAALTRSLSLDQLFARGGAGRAEVDVAKSMAAAAGAKVNSAEVRLNGCTITAPFDGRISEYSVNTFEYVEPAQPMFSIVSSGKPDLEIIAPDNWLRWIAPGEAGQVQLEATAGVFYIVVTGVSPVVDPVSQTVKLSADFKGEADSVLPGMSGLVHFELSQ